MILLALKAVLTLVVVVAAATAGYFLVDAIDGEDPEPAASTGSGLVIRALGDSVTAGFGYADRDGDEFGFTELPFCASRAAHPRCQDPDGVAYPARFAATVEDANFQSYATSGSTPADWLGEGKKAELNARLEASLAKVVAADPDVTVLTLGANPLLDSFLTDVGRRLCASTTSREKARACIRKALAEEHAEVRLQRIYELLLDTKPDGRRGLVVVFQYPESRPPSAIGVNVAVLVEELRAVISRAVALAIAADPGNRNRLVIAEPGPFLVHGCDDEEPWILDVDTCIHPNAVGHERLAAVLAAVVAAHRDAAARPAPDRPERFAEPGVSCGVYAAEHTGAWQAFESRLAVARGRAPCAELEGLVERYMIKSPTCTIANGASSCALRIGSGWDCTVAGGVWFRPANIACERRGDRDRVYDFVGLLPAETTPTTFRYECGDSGEGGGPFNVRANFACEEAMRVAASLDHKFGFRCRAEATGLESSHSVCTLDAARVEWDNGA